MPDLSIRQLVATVSSDLIASQKEREERGDQANFELSEMVLEISFIVTESTTGRGGFDLKVIKADAGTKYDEQQTHKVTLRFRTRQGSDEAGLGLLPLRPRLSEQQ
jgi:Trypsin-co-occurring domain 2